MGVKPTEKEKEKIKEKEKERARTAKVKVKARARARKKAVAMSVAKRVWNMNGSMEGATSIARDPDPMEVTRMTEQEVTLSGLCVKAYLVSERPLMLRGCSAWWTPTCTINQYENRCDLIAVPIRRHS